MNSPIELIEDTTLIETATSFPWDRLLGLAIAGLALAWFLWRRAKKRAPGSLPGVFAQVDPADVALGKLAALRQRLDAVSAKEFSLDVSELLRKFLEERLECNAAHESSEEFLQKVAADARFSGSEREGLREFLVTCDFSKFARKDLEQAAKWHLLEHAEQFVHRFRDPAPVNPETSTERYQP